MENSYSPEQEELFKLIKRKIDLKNAHKAENVTELLVLESKINKLSREVCDDSMDEEEIADFLKDLEEDFREEKNINLKSQITISVPKTNFHPFVKFLIYWIAFYLIIAVSGTGLAQYVLAQTLYVPKAITFCKLKGYEFKYLIYKRFDENGKVKKDSKGNHSILPNGCTCSIINPKQLSNDLDFEFNFFGIPDILNNFFSFISADIFIILTLLSTYIAYKLSFSKKKNKMAI